jgi:hypothetical protein
MSFFSRDNPVKDMQRAGMTVYGDEKQEKKELKDYTKVRIGSKDPDTKDIRIRIPYPKNILGALWGGIKRVGRGFKKMYEGGIRASKSETGEKVKGGLMNMYNNFYGKE